MIQHQYVISTDQYLTVVHKLVSSVQYLNFMYMYLISFHPSHQGVHGILINK